MKVVLSYDSSPGLYKREQAGLINSEMLMIALSYILKWRFHRRCRCPSLKGSLRSGDGYGNPTKKEKGKERNFIQVSSLLVLEH